MSKLQEISGANVFYFVVMVATRLVVAFEYRIKNYLHNFTICIDNFMIRHLFNKFHRWILVKTISQEICSLFLKIFYVLLELVLNFSRSDFEGRTECASIRLVHLAVGFQLCEILRIWLIFWIGQVYFWALFCLQFWRFSWLSISLRIFWVSSQV